MKSPALEQLQVAFDFDRLGKEAKAVPHYRLAIKLGLSEPNLRDALIGLGSSLRVLGRLSASRRVLVAARKRYPNDAAIEMFLALTRFEAGEKAAAVRILSQRVIAQTQDLDYIPALKRYFASLK